ncbi:hypothetical protein [Microlunatus sp. Y2014]|uniref:hypothetical protein n=1 Tax=Microlunatus sp. Y2014 TaxID=3418488 RepID=UPI003DA71DFA
MDKVDNPVFDDLFDAGAPKVLDGSHSRDEPPVDRGRWPVSVVAFPPEAVREQFGSWTQATVERAGRGHFHTGGPDTAHLTVRALERYRETAAATDPVAAVWRTAMERAAADTEPIRLLFTGLTLTRSGVLAQLEPVDHAAWELMARLRRELGSEAWLEDGWMKRNIWYASLLHFADRVADPEGLVDWVRANRRIEPVEFMISSLSLVRFRHRQLDGEQAMVPETWCTASLQSPSTEEEIG